MGKQLYMSREDYHDFMAGIETLQPRKMSIAQIKLMFKVLLTGAFRISEVLALTPEDLLPDGRLRLLFTKGGWKRCKCSKWTFRPITLVSSDKECKKCHGEGKYRTAQYGWIQDDVLHELEELADGTEPGEKLFPITRRQALNYANDISNARTHTFRHSWLTWMLESGNMNIRDIKAKARHTSLATTDKYIETNDAYTRRKEGKGLQI